MTKSRTEIVAAIENVLGKPYVLGADGPDAYDCYGVTRYIQRECFEIQMPEVQRVDVSGFGYARRLLAHAESGNWVWVKEANTKPVEGDIAVMGNVDGRDWHMGVMIRDGINTLCVHADDNAGVCVDDLITLPVKGYFNFKYMRHISRTATAIGG